MKSYVLLLAALAAVSAVEVTHHKDKPAEDDVEKLIERTNEVTHHILEFEDKIDHRINPKRLQKAGSLRARVEALEEPSCDEHYYQCGGDDPQCISGLFVCDGKADCRNGEDEKHCELPTKAGDKFVGDVVFDDCTKRKPDHMTLVVETVHIAPYFTAVPELHVHLEIEHEDDEEDAEASLPSDAIYSFADHSLIVYPPEADGLGLVGHFDGYNNDRFVGEIVHSQTEETCAKFIFHRVTDDDDDDDHHHDHHDDHKKDHH